VGGVGRTSVKEGWPYDLVRSALHTSYHCVSVFNVFVI